jgi:phosphoglucosamine mutase
MSTPRRYFGTDGVRGPYGGPLINEAFALRLGYAAARWAGGRGQVVIGRDTRGSGASLAAALARGLAAGGLHPVLLGVLPSPAVSFAVLETKAVLGAVITASHNPAEDNGIKFFASAGQKLSDEDEARIEALLPAEPPEAPAAPTTEDARPEAAYSAAAGQLLPAHALRGWRIVVDTANGATHRTTPAVFRAYGAEVIGLGDLPDGRNINAGVGSQYPEALAARVRATGARLGVAHDGDGDRCLLSDEKGEILDGDEILVILALQALAEKRLAAQTLVVTEQSNLGVDAAIRAAGGQVLRTAIGDRYVFERMQAVGARLGGESSGHVICSVISPGGDGLVAALKVIEVMRASGLPLSVLRRGLRKFPQRVDAVPVREKRPLATMPALSATLQRLQQELGDRGRVLVRYSGTEPKLRLLVEGETEAGVQSGLAQLRAAVQTDLTAAG